MVKKRSRAATEKHIRLATSRGAYLLLGLPLLLLMMAAGAAAQMLWAAATPEPVAYPTNIAGVSPVSAGHNSTQTLNLYGGQMRPLVEEGGGSQTLNIYGPGGQIIAQVVQDDQGTQEVRYLLADHLGSTRAVLDAEADAVARYEYAPYGNTTASGESAATIQYRYTGHRYDEGREVYETPARGYEPTVGRFLSVDPQRYHASPYLYAGNNPVGYVDPTGGIEVPFFVVSGMKLKSDGRGGALSRSIARGFGLRNDQKVYSSHIFNSPPRHTAGYALTHASSVLFGHGDQSDERGWKYNDKLYWLIGKDQDVNDLSQFGPVLEAMRAEFRRRMKSDFASEIVLIDFSEGANRSHPIMTKLSSLGVSVRLVRAGIDYVPDHQRTLIAGTLTHGSGQYTPEQFGDIVGTTNRLDEPIPPVDGQEPVPYSSLETVTTPSAATTQPTGATAGQEHSLQTLGGQVESTPQRSGTLDPRLWESHWAPNPSPDLPWSDRVGYQYFPPWDGVGYR